MYTQQESRQRSSTHTPSGAITTFYTLLCFSLAGLLMGFAFGGFAGHLSRGSAIRANVPTSSAPVLTRRTPDPSATVENIFSSTPAIVISNYTSSETADGTTSYQFSVQIVNKTDRQPITSTNVLCRLWLTNDIQATTAALSSNNYAIPRNPTMFNQAFPQEITGALTFTAPSQQTESCAANGKTSWTYTLATSVPQGTYYLAVLADWQGVHYDWYMEGIRVHNIGNRSN